MNFDLNFFRDAPQQVSFRNKSTFLTLSIRRSR